MNFNELNLNADLQKAIQGLGFDSLTPIQEKSIPHALEGRDITGLSQTGTGKTLCYLLPIVNKLLNEKLEGHCALIIAPTRELVIQIFEEGKKLLKHSDKKIAAVYGGVGYKEQEKEFSENVSIIVATPGRLVDHLKSGNLNLEQVKFFVLDEADRMFDMGFIKDIRFVMKKCPTSKQTLMFSATLSYYVIRLASEYLNDPIEIEVEPDKITAENIDQTVYHLGRDEKLPYIVNLIKKQGPEDFGIIFTNLRSMVPEITNTLNRFGIPATGISSSLDQKKRIRILKEFKLGKYKYMVATDVASRGLDIDDLTYIYNFDLPSDPESYVHRIGRTARAGKSGFAINFCSERDYNELEKIERFLNKKLSVAEVDDSLLQYPLDQEVKDYEMMNVPNNFRRNDRRNNDRRNHRNDRNDKRNRNNNRRERNDRNEKSDRNERSDRSERNDNSSNRRFDRKKFEHNKGKTSHRKHQKQETYNKPVREIDELEKAKKVLEKSDTYLNIEKPSVDKFSNKTPVTNFKDHPKKEESVPKEESKSYDKSKRNLFDINDLPKHENQKPQSIWKKIRSFFGS